MIISINELAQLENRGNRSRLCLYSLKKEEICFTARGARSRRQCARPEMFVLAVLPIHDHDWHVSNGEECQLVASLWGPLVG